MASKVGDEAQFIHKPDERCIWKGGLLTSHEFAKVAYIFSYSIRAIGNPQLRLPDPMPVQLGTG